MSTNRNRLSALVMAATVLIAPEAQAKNASPAPAPLCKKTEMITTCTVSTYKELEEILAYLSADMFEGNNVTLKIPQKALDEERDRMLKIVEEYPIQLISKSRTGDRVNAEEKDKKTGDEPSDDAPAAQLSKGNTELQQCTATVDDNKAELAAALKAAEAEKINLTQCEEKLSAATEELTSRLNPLESQLNEAQKTIEDYKNDLQEAHAETDALKKQTLIEKALEEWEKTLAALAALSALVALAAGAVGARVTHRFMKRRRRQEQEQERNGLRLKTPEGGSKNTFETMAIDEHLAYQLELVVDSMKRLTNAEASAFYDMSEDQVKKILQILENRLGVQIQKKLRKDLIKVTSITDDTKRADEWNRLLA